VRDLTLQFHPQRAPGLPLATVLGRLAEVGATIAEVRTVTITRGRDRGPYVNVSFSLAAKHLPLLWSLLRKRGLGSDSLGRKLRASSMVYCEGSRGWDNYKLLHHFDSRQKLDRLPPSNNKLQRKRGAASERADG
jgi:hypothetical protein